MGKASRRASRERLKQERMKARQRAKRNKILAVIGAAVAVIALVVGAGTLYLYQQKEESQEFAEQYDSLPSQTLQQDGSVVLAKEDTQAPVVEVYADFQCPACGQLEETTGPTLQKLAADGDAIVHYRPVSIFATQGSPTGSNSLRGAAAARAAANYGKFVEYHDILFQNQGPENAAGFEPDELKEWGDTVGIDDPEFDERVDAESEVVDEFSGDYLNNLVEQARSEFGQEEMQNMALDELVQWGDENGLDSSFMDGTYVEEVVQATGEVKRKYPEDFQGTPAVFVNGSALGNEVYSADGMKQAVQDAKAGTVGTEPAASGDNASPSAEAETDDSADDEK